MWRPEVPLFVVLIGRVTDLVPRFVLSPPFTRGSRFGRHFDDNTFMHHIHCIWQRIGNDAYARSKPLVILLPRYRGMQALHG